MATPDAPIAKVEVGLVVEGRYRVDGLLGAGGMGVVARARDLRLGRDVALKLLPSETVGDAAARARLLREARAMAAFTHPHVVHVYDAGETADGGAYLAMELVVGETVRAKLDSAWPLSERLRALVDAARALGAAHEAGLIHRDVKPDNLMLRRGGRVVLLDFGIVRRQERDAGAGDSTTAALTGKDAVVGTIAYMSPEQALASELDGRSDQFSFGVTAFEVLTGEYPWPRTTVAARLSALLTVPTPRASERVEVPAAVDDVLGRATAKEPGERFASMEAFADALEAAAAHVSASAGASVPPSSVASTPGSDAFARTEAASSASRAPAASVTARSGAAEAPTGEAAKTLRPAAQGAAREAPTPPTEGSGRRAALALGAVLAFGVATAGLGAWLGRRGSPGAEGAAAGGRAGTAASAPDAATAAPSQAELDELAAGTTNAEAHHAFLAGLQAWHDGDWVRAEREWERASTIDPGYGAAHLWLAVGVAGGEMIRARKAFEGATAARASLGPENQALYAAYAPVIQTEPPDIAAGVAALEDATRRWPRSAYLAARLAGLRYNFEFAAPSTLAAIERTLALDPGLVQVLHFKGQHLAYRGRFDEALATLERCAATAPGPSSCLSDELQIHVQRGQCQEAANVARRWQRLDARASRPYLGLAGAALSEHQPVEAVEELLAQYASRVSDELRAVEKANARFVAEALRGDFLQAHAAATEAEALVAEAPDRASHTRQRRLLIELARETGDLAEAGRLADDLLKRLGSWLPDPRNEDWAIGKDAEPYLLDVLVEAGKLSTDERASRRGAWLGAWRARANPFYHPFLWLNAYAGLVRDEAGAREALAAMPEGGVPPFFSRIDPDPGLARMFLLTGQPERALPYLRRAAEGCDGVAYPLRHVQSAVPLGLALERTGDREGACKAYRSAQARWGKAKPRSVTAEKAKALADKLGCTAR